MKYTKEIPSIGEYDVVVVGAGMAGVSAAIASGRSGARTCLVEKLQSIGGIATSGLMNLFYSPYEYVTGFGKELFNYLRATKDAFGEDEISFDAEACINVMFKLLKDAEVTLLLDTWLCDVIMEQGEVIGLVVMNKDGLGYLSGKKFIDSTGDGDLCYMAGYPYEKGREKDNKMRPLTLLFNIGGIDAEKFLSYIENNPSDFSPDPNQCIVNRETGEVRVFGFFSLVEKAKSQGYLYPSCNYFRIEAMFIDRGIATINTIRIYDADGTSNKDVVHAIVESRYQQEKLLEFMKAFVPGMENVFITATGQIIGARDTRRILGEKHLTEEALIASPKVPDTIGVCTGRQTLGMRGEGHTPDGTEGSASDYAIREAVGQLVSFEIPYGILVVKDRDNVLVAGRNVSCDFLAHKHLRNQPACVTTGYAAGLAAAISVKEGISLRSVEASTIREMERKTLK